MLDVAAQIAGGLAAAHDAGVVHRDIKPDNLLISRDGRVRILDFGLATEQLPADDGAGVTRAVTSAGTVLGTVAYMSPEQARGTLADARSDQFSFGLVLYELACGRRAFARDSAVQTLSAIIEADPDLAPLAALPVHVRWIIERCLAKDPADRYASTADLYRDLRHLRDRQSEIGQSGVRDLIAAPARRRRVWPAVAAIVALGVIAATTFIWLQRDRGVSLDAYRFVPFAVDAGVQSMPAWSPDGQGLAFSGEVDGYYQIFTRRLDQSTASQVTRLPGDCVYPVWDPDGTRVFFQLTQRGNQGFVARANEIWVVSAAGGAPERLVAGAPAFAVAPDGSQLAFLGPASGKDDGTYVVRAFDLRNKTTRELVQIPGKWPGGYTPASPGFKFSPDGSALALTGQGTADMIVLSNPLLAGGGAVRTVRFAPSGGGALSLYEFDWAPDSRHVVLVLRDSLGGDQSLWTGDRARHGHPAHRLIPVGIHPGGVARWHAGRLRQHTARLGPARDRSCQRHHAPADRQRPLRRLG